MTFHELAEIRNPVGADFIERSANLLAHVASMAALLIRVAAFANKLALRSMKSAPTGFVDVVRSTAVPYAMKPALNGFRARIR